MASKGQKFQERYFQIIYNMLIGKDVGPKMGLFLSSIDSETISHLLVKTGKKQY